jgi:hypothetical protein
VTDLQRLGVKLFAEDADGVELPEFIPIFHRWIQGRVLDQLLIDVADYSHVLAGPGILLVAHEGNFSIDEQRSRRGLAYYAKREMEGDLQTRLAALCRTTIAASRRLAAEPELDGRLRFRGDDICVFANDRLMAPNTEDTFERMEPVLRDLARTLYPDIECSLSREPDPKERFAVTLSAGCRVDTADLLARLG